MFSDGDTEDQRSKVTCPEPHTHSAVGFIETRVPQFSKELWIPEPAVGALRRS